VGVVDVLDEVKRTLEPIAARQGIEIVVDSIPDRLPMVAADRTRFLQILMNLGSNAIKYNRPAGKVTLIVSTSPAGFVRVTVRDTGMGIPADKQGKLFQPFQRAGQETGSIEGTGIGLVITRRLAQLMSGEVGFKSSGDGSEFWVDIPTHASGARTAAPAQTAETNHARVAKGSQRTILYVEDNPANVAFMRDLVGTFEDIELLSAPTAEVGIELARASKPAAIIMDINLPGMSGLDALRALRGTTDTSQIPIIALTAAASERDQQRGTQAGFYRYLTKPVKVDELVNALDSLLAPRT
jgi:CheY-like chemotaxis protein